MCRIRRQGRNRSDAPNWRGFKCAYLLLATFFTIAFAIAFAQDALPQFEVATVKPPGPQDRAIILYNYPGGRVVISLYTFELLLHEALGVQRFQVVGAPPWIESERFMILGTAA